MVNCNKGRGSPSYLHCRHFNARSKIYLCMCSRKIKMEKPRLRKVFRGNFNGRQSDENWYKGEMEFEIIRHTLLTTWNVEARRRRKPVQFYLIESSQIKFRLRPLYLTHRSIASNSIPKQRVMHFFRTWERDGKINIKTNFYFLPENVGFGTWIL